MSWQAKTVEGLLRVIGAKRNGQRPETVDRNIAKARAKAKDPAPRERQRRELNFSERAESGMRVFELAPKSGEPTHHVVYFHGGSYTFDIAPPHWFFLAHLARMTGVRVIVPIYPLAPESTADQTVPIATDVAERVIDAVGSDAVTVMGDSAGGGLSLAVVQELKKRGKQPRGTVLISPWLDVSMTDPGLAAIDPRDAMLTIPGLAHCGRLYAGALDAKDPLASPLFGDLDGLAPIDVYTGTHDLLNVDAHNLVERAAGQGVEIRLHEEPGMPHVHPLLSIIPEGKRARDQIMDNVRSGSGSNLLD